MDNQLKLMCVLAHPDDEALGIASTIPRYVAEGVDVYLVTATRGERGWSGSEEDFPGLAALGKIREAELRCAARHLGIRQVEFLDYIDGDLDQADPAEAIEKIVICLRRVRPQVVITFPPDGAYGHPDHIAICQFTTAATVCAADREYSDSAGLASFRVPKLYYMADSQELFDEYFKLFGDIRMKVDGVERQAVAWCDWAITTHIDAQDHWRTVWEAVQCHTSQLHGLGDLTRITDTTHQRIWSERTYYRAYSLVNGGRKPETDLFDGLRQ
jgi:LmbE family N-acetylglucosaminyl deacetylase